MKKIITLKELYDLYEEMPEMTLTGDILINFTIYVNDTFLYYDYGKLDFDECNVEKVVITDIDTAINKGSYSHYINDILDYRLDRSELQELNIYSISVYCKK